jgi:hypothetical protein
LLTSAPMPAAVALPPTLRLRPIGIGALGLTLVVALGLAVGGEALGFIASGVPAIALAGMAVLARLGVERRWARVTTLVLGGATMVAIGLILFSLSAATLVPSDPTGQLTLAPGAPVKLLLLVVGLTGGGLIGLVGLVPPWRRALARLLPLDPTSFPAGVAAAGVLAMTVMGAIPLLVLAGPPLLAMMAAMPGLETDAGAMLRQLVYGLLWLVPAAAIAAGWGLGRDRGAVLARLGLVRPTRGQVIGGLVVAVGLTVASRLISLGVAEVWTTMGWARTDGALVAQLFGFALSPIGALVVGVTAGLGEELLVRGLLQPRVGLLLGNLCFTSMHALQYNWDALVLIFVMGTVFGLVRRRTNTTTSALVHGTVDALLVLYAIFGGADV